ncbi:MAG: hypothetical protein DWQ02_06540 [Bacteroidetes bacterium]|nr:MAG: hypothetical protein DWQ02_06540 [Bacteroidota bacterium]
MPIKTWADGNFRKYTKEIKREFSITPRGDVHISNKYGQVDIRTWEKNRVKVTVEIAVNAENESAAQKVFNRIDVKFKSDNTEVSAETVIEDTRNKWWDWSSGQLDYAINYQVYMPASANLSLDNKYGEVYVSSVSGDVDLSLKYVNFIIDALSGSSTSSLGNSHGSIGSVNNMNLAIKSGSISIGEANNMEIGSKSATVNIGKAKLIVSNTSYDNYTIGTIVELHNDGKFDNFEIGDAEDIFMESSYSNVIFQDINKYLILDLDNCNASINKLSTSFKEAKLIGNNTDFQMVLEPGIMYQLDAFADYAKVEYPKQMSVTYEEEESTTYAVKGVQGGKSGNAPFVKVRLKYGSLKMTY